MRNLGLWGCGFALLTGLAVGCGGGKINIEGEGFNYPQVLEGRRTTEPSLLTAAGGQVTFETSLQRRGDTYLTDSAPMPSFSVLESSSRPLVEDQPLLFKEQYVHPDGYNIGNSGVYSGSFTVPVNTSSRSQEYRIIVKVPRAEGSPYRQEFTALVVPTPVAP